MQVYLVGGAVRDQLLGLKGADRDYVVVGSTVEEMKKLGFNQVGRDFPVFLHPKTHEEYALARTERKNGHGYVGFTCDFNQNITLEDDLIRRDLTINAMAMDLTMDKKILKRRSYVMSQMHLLKILYEFYVLQDSMLATIT